MDKLNQFRKLAGLPVDYYAQAAREKEQKLEEAARQLAEAAKPAQLTEARKVPGRKADIEKQTPENMKKRLKQAELAVDHVEEAIACLERIPAIDVNGDVQHMIQELEAVLNDSEDGVSLNTMLSGIQTQFRKFRRNEKVTGSVEAEAEECLMSYDEEEEINARLKSLPPILHISGDPKMSKKSNKIDGWVSNLGDDTEREVTVEFDYTKGDVGNMNPDSSSFGPATDAEIEIYSIVDKDNGEEIDPQTINLDQAEDEIMDSVSAYMEPQEQEEVVKEGKKEIFEPIDLDDSGYESDPEDDRDESPHQLEDPMSAGTSPQDQSVGDEATVKVPARIKSALQKEIDEARKEAKKLDVRDKEASYFYNDLANAFEDLLNHLKGGTRGDIKQAQIYFSSLMGPMLHKLPAPVVKFLANGGERVSLKDYYKPVDSKYPITGPRNVLK